MANLGQTRKGFTVAAVLLGGISVLAALALLVPFQPSAESRVVELNEARLTLKRLEGEVGPLRGLPAKLTQARVDIDRFYQERFPERFSAIPEALGKLSSEYGVRLSDVKYETAETEMPSLQLVTMEANLSGDYAKVVRFINGMERSKVFFLIDRITLGEEGTGGDVRLQVRILSILRGATLSNPGGRT